MPSGGSINTALSIFDIFSVKEFKAANAPYALSPIPGPKTRDPTSWITKIFGFRSVPDLGILTTSIGAIVDVPIVHRSWGLLGGANFYGPNFHFSEYMKARNYLGAIAFHFAVSLLSVLLAIPLVRKLARRFVYQPGEGATKEQTKKDRVEYRGVGKPDVKTPNPPRAYCRAHYEGGLYQCKSTPCFDVYTELMVGSDRFAFGRGCDFDSEGWA
jgi:hypothetical protein